MHLPVLIEPVANNGYRARSGEPLPLVADGPSREEALEKLRLLVDQRLKNGTEVASLELGGKPTDNPWRAMAGMFKDDPYFDDWLRSIEEYRRKVDEDPEIP